MRESAFLLKGVKISLTDERGEEPIHEVFLYEEGIKEFVDYLNEEKDTLTQVVYFSGTKEAIEVELAFQYNDGYSENVLSFVNNVRTKDGGTHEVGMKTSMTKAFNEYARKVNLLKEKDKNLEGSDFREGLAAVLSIRVPENLLQFEGQTKGKLGTPLARNAVDNVIGEQLGYYLQENSEMSQMLVRKAIKAERPVKLPEKREKKAALERNAKRGVTAFWKINACTIS